MSQPWSAPPLELVLSARDGRTGEEITLEDLFDRLARADVVFLGETHLDETTHRLELATYDALIARRAGDVVLALEMFERDAQPVLDSYLAGTIDEPEFLSRARPWSNYRTAYRPLIERAREERLPVVASNFPSALRAQVASGGLSALDALPADERRHAPLALLPNTPAYWRRVDNAIRGHKGMIAPRAAGDEQRLTDTQSLWDNSMGEACARALVEHPGALVLHVNGGFHSEYRDGTVRQLLLRAPEARVLTVAITPTDSPRAVLEQGVPRADFVVYAEERARDVDDGEHAVSISRELEYRLFVPASAHAGARVPLLVWLGDDGASARESLAEWKERLGESAAIVAIEPPYRETQEDLVEGGRWFWPDSFSSDVGTLAAGVEEVWAFALRHHPIDPERTCVAGEGTGATVVAATALLAGGLEMRAIALAPRRFARLKDLPLPLPELAGDAPRPARSLFVLADGDDASWWTDEAGEYRGIGLSSELAVATDDPWRADLERENAVRTGLELAPRSITDDAPRSYVVAESSRARGWARQLALRRSLETGELVAVVPEPLADDSATRLPTTVHVSEFRGERALPRCPGPFGGTTVVVLPENLPAEEIEGWLALETDDPLAKSSRFHRLRVVTGVGERALAGVLAQLFEAGRKNVLVVPAVFCADGATMRALQNEVRALEDRMTISWRPGLGSPADAGR